MNRSESGRGAAVVCAAVAGLLCAAIAVLIDAVATAIGGAATGREVAGILVYELAIFGALGSGFGAFIGFALHEARLRVDRYDIMVAAGCLGHTLAIGYIINLWTRASFNNAELASLLAAVALLATLLAVGLGARATLIWARRRRYGAIIAASLWGATSLAAVGWALYQNASGFEQLNRTLLLQPLALTPAFVVASSARMRKLFGRRAWGRAVAAIVGVSILGTVGLELYTSAGQAVASSAPLGRWIAPVVHRVTDVDGDGFSSILGGGDCAPFDAAIAPGKLDTPGDGIDNNCIGGDAQPPQARAAAPWYDVPDTQQQPDIVLITIETLRSDHVSFMGYSRKTTPNLDLLAEEATVFERFFSSSTFTRLALASLFSARTPSRVIWESQAGSAYPRIATDNPWLPEALQEAGYETAAITSQFSAFTDKERIGFERGFDHYDSSAKLKYRGGTMRGFPSKAQVKSAGKWLKALPKNKPAFLWVHIMEPHFRYEQFPKAPKWGKKEIDKYDSEIWGADRAVGDIVELMKKNRRWDQTVLAVTGDHGEEFKEHGNRFHGSNLYEPQVRTPLLLRVPGAGGRRITSPAGFTDVAATLANLGGAKDGYTDFKGRNLTSVLFGEPMPEEPIFMEVWKVKTRSGYHAAIVNWPYKIVVAGMKPDSAELFDLQKDPAEKNDIVKEQRDVAQPMREQLIEFLDGTRLEYVKPKAATPKLPTLTFPEKPAPGTKPTAAPPAPPSK